MSSKRTKRHSAPAHFSRDEDSEGEEVSRMEIDSTSHQLRRNEDSLRKSMTIDVGLRKGQRQQRLEEEFEIQFRELEAQVDDRAERHQEDM
ncbi:hypothetical protein AYL99_10675 [Fonsecaea erecta]|uniref:Uncharacterized protein n=1 Tax=Fonsecaea erecta TaxID=1367422 RepID=A0A178Z7F3_9EURO|nr:hypothetical protein AYL99_10675 [Fonsecaea erecta]OAP54975.1 hypothetical protein AYL99_10675 [Fonsecaea erecta]